MRPSVAPMPADFPNFCPQISVVRPFGPQRGNAALGLAVLRGLPCVSARRPPLKPVPLKIQFPLGRFGVETEMIRRVTARKATAPLDGLATADFGWTFRGNVPMSYKLQPSIPIFDYREPSA